MRLALRWWPRTLVGRVFALYALTLTVFVGMGLGLFLRHQYDAGVDAAVDDAQTLFSVLVPVVTESAVIGDYDTIGRQLKRAARHSGVAEIAYTDAHGIRLVGNALSRPHPVPDWLASLVAQRLHDSEQSIEAGGTAYGRLALQFSSADIAQALWREALVALALAASALLGGVLAIRRPLVRWLGQLDRIGDLDPSLHGGRALARQALTEDTPLEFKRTFEVLDRAAANLQTEREQAQAARDSALAHLRQVLERTALPDGARAATDDDLEAVSQLVSSLMARLQAHSAQLDAIFGISPDGFVSFNADRVVRYVSPGFVALTGLAPDTVLGVEEDVLLHRLRSRAVDGGGLARLHDLAGPQDREPVRIEMRQPRGRMLALAMHAGKGGAVSQVLHLRDITHESEVDRMKSEFLTMAAHELRTPMASIFGYVELMIAREFTPERRHDVLATVHRQCLVMMNLVNELLDLARIEARRDLDFRFEVVSLPKLAADAVAAFLPPGGREPVRVTAADGSAVDWQVQVDSEKFQRVLGNVLSNAYKYSPGGGAVELRFLPASADAALDGTPPRLGLQVQDHGIGMTPEQLLRVGERFYRADASGNIPGTGLGMRLVREIMSLMGGDVTLDSVPGEGTVVTLWLPQAVTATALPMPQTEPA